MNPLDLPAAEFLRLWVGLTVLALGLATFLRWRLRAPGGPAPEEASELEPYAVSYLKGGERATIAASLCRLVHEGRVEFDFEDRKLKRRPGGLELAALDQAVYRAVLPEPREAVEAARPSCAAALAPIRRRLQKLGLLVGPAQAEKARSWPLLAVVPVLALGAVRAAFDLSRGRPFETLMGIWVAVMLVTLFAFGRPVHRSRRGDEALALSRRKNAALEQRARDGGGSLTGDELVVALALFDVADVRLAKLRQCLRPVGSIDGGG